MTDNLRGALYMTAAMLFFLINDSFMKSLSDELPLMQALMLRGAGTILVLLVMAAVRGGLRFDLPRRDWGLVLLRMLGEIGGAYFFISALFHMPLGNAQAILQALPLAVTLAAALFLGEPVGWRRLTAIGIGFVGVMLIVRPGTEGFNVYSLYALMSVLAVVLRDLATRKMSPEVPAMTVALATAAGVCLFGTLGTLTEGWVPVSPKAGLQLSAAVIFVFLGYMFSIMTMRTGEIAFVSPFRYTSLVFALFVGFVVFDEWPRPLTLLGAAIVVGTGLFSFWREQRLARAEAARAGATG